MKKWLLFAILGFVAGCGSNSKDDRNEAARTLFNIGQGVRSCEDAGIPLDDIRDKGGKALLSWRVRVLVFIEQDYLYKEFKLDEPWDSPHNRKLLEKMPKEFARSGVAATETTIHLIRGPGTMFPGSKGIKPWEGGLPAGAAAPFYLVEAAEGVPWTKPADLTLPAGNGFPPVAKGPGGTLAVFADGKVRIVPADTDTATLRALATVDGAGRVPLDRFPEHPHAAAHRKNVEKFMEHISKGR